MSMNLKDTLSRLRSAPEGSEGLNGNRGFAPRQTRVRPAMEEETSFNPASPGAPPSFDGHTSGGNGQHFPNGAMGGGGAYSDEAEAAYEPPMDTAVNLKRLESALRKSRLEEIADIGRVLTYGEMIQFAHEITEGKPAAKDFDAAAASKEIIDLAARIWKWTNSRLSEVPASETAPEA